MLTEDEIKEMYDQAFKKHFEPPVKDSIFAMKLVRKEFTRLLIGRAALEIWNRQADNKEAYSENAKHYSEAIDAVRSLAPETE